MNESWSFKEISKQSLAEQVAARLKESLLNGEFPHGKRIPEERLAAAFQISRTPLRQAMQQLEQSGLLVKHPSGGMQPAPLTLQDVTDAVEVRASLEALLAKRAASNATDEEIMQLLAYSNLFDATKKTKNIQQLIAINNKIHIAIRYAAKSPLLIKILDDLDSRIEKVVRLYLNVATIDIWTATDHGGIIRYIQDRECEKAGQAMQEHVLFAGTIAIDYMKKHHGKTT